MVDLIDKVLESEDMNNSSSQITTPERVSSNGGTYLKTCADCGTTKTPLWRGGPAGPKSLCNACGIRSRKKRRALLGLSNKEEKKSKKSSNNGQQNQQQNNDNNKYCSSTSKSSKSRSGDQNSSNSNPNAKSRIVDISMKRKLLTFGRDVALQRPRSSGTSQRKKLREEEQAAFLLMALSCGSVYA